MAPSAHLLEEGLSCLTPSILPEKAGEGTGPRMGRGHQKPWGLGAQNAGGSTPALHLQAKLPLGAAGSEAEAEAVSEPEPQSCSCHHSEALKLMGADAHRGMEEKQGGHQESPAQKGPHPGSCKEGTAL